MTSRVPDVHRQQLPARVVKADRREARRARAGEEAGLLWGKTGAKDCFWLGNRAPRVCQPASGSALKRDSWTPVYKRRREETPTTRRQQGTTTKRPSIATK